MNWSTLPERIENNIIPEPNSGCWLWLGSMINAGYGTIRYHGIDLLAHRLVYELTHGPIKNGLHIDHLCRVRLCCNPAHLEPVTPGENARRGETGQYQKQFTHCPQGHPYDESNTRLYQGRRYCRKCHMICVWKGRGKI